MLVWENHFTQITLWDWPVPFYTYFTFEVHRYNGNRNVAEYVCLCCITFILW